MYVNAKMIHVETVPGIGGGGDEREQQRGVNSSIQKIYIQRIYIFVLQCTPTQRNNRKKNRIRYCLKRGVSFVRSLWREVFCGMIKIS
jgi:hypothetical protein